GYGRSARRRRARRDARLLQRFSDRELGDIGLTRFDLVWRD
ncbi:DUF1127 domain-containing protein, partial [Mesorhizobium sp. IMUNJ 23232]